MRAKFCKTNEELNEALQEYIVALTPEKCASFIMRLEKVDLI